MAAAVMAAAAVLTEREALVTTAGVVAHTALAVVADGVQIALAGALEVVGLCGSSGPETLANSRQLAQQICELRGNYGAR